MGRKKALTLAAKTPNATLLEREDSTLVAWYRCLYAPRAGGAYDSHHRTEGIAGRTRRRGGQHGRSRQPLLRLRISQYPLRVISGKATAWSSQPASGNQPRHRNYSPRSRSPPSDELAGMQATHPAPMTPLRKIELK